MTKDLIIGLMAGALGAVFLLLALSAWISEKKRKG